MTDSRFTVRVWDLPTRCFHWLLAACVIVAVASAWLGGNAMAWHFRAGYAVFTLLAFRLLWGFVGGRWSRFGRFLYGPAALRRYLFGHSLPEEQHEVGHSPLGALSVFALLAVLGAQVATGLFADDEIANTGPLQVLVSEATSHALTHWHRGVGQWLVIGLVSLHVLAVGYYVVARRREIVGPMVFGDKRLEHPAVPSLDNARTRLLAGGLLLACGLGVACIVNSQG